MNEEKDREEEEEGKYKQTRRDKCQSEQKRNQIPMSKR
jgi:hypothetical protein